MTTEKRILRQGWDEAVNFIEVVGKEPTSVSIFHPFGGGYNIQFGPHKQVVEAWRKSGEASDASYCRLMEEMTIVKNKNKELNDENKGLKDQLESFEANFEEVTKGRHEAMYELDQIRDELESVLKASKEMENQHQLQHNTVNLDAEKAEKEILQLREKITMLNGELFISQDANSQQKEKYETQSEEQKRLLQSANGKLKTAVERSKSISLELMKAKDSVLINEAASKERKKESDEKINLMEIALSEAKLNNQIANNTSALKSNEAENSKTTQTEPISANDESSEEFNLRAVTWENMVKIGELLERNPIRICGIPYVYVQEFDNFDDNGKVMEIYIRKNPELEIMEK
eukprot:CAMPEP_0185745568 /NCGR_PEP_ID=MMETSP1174-20130828/3944_1 /TAXON_ID=35687 /ORGANISM="Dictyocha speculum, Strain CCMP1381" /LENGTH=346 /DNA_ID=CAMNT_0028419667 /DNA_START=32 /DNA_END=1072 /DNA_ORIENTATION=+